MPLLERVRGALHGLLPPTMGAEGTDGEHLARFTTAHDEAAFAELVRRHGPMVYGIAKRILGNGADADDTLQATFFVLARKASSIRTPELVRAWLYGVAVKTAHKLRQQALKRRLRQMAVAKPEAVTPAIPEADWWATVDTEIAALPETLRQVFLTCDVGGQSRSQAAKELGWPEGTVAKRLAKARVELAKRLTRRGLTLSVPALTATLASDTTASVPSGLLAETITQALAFGLRAGIGPLGVQTLAETVLMGMKASALKAWMGVGLLLALLSGGLMWAGGGAPPVGKNGDGKNDVTKTSTPAKPDVGWREKSALEFVWLPGSVAYSADGTKLVIGGTEGNVSVHEAATLKKLWATKLNADFSAVTYHQGSGAVVATHKDGAIFLNATTGKESLRIEAKDSNPIAVADLPSFEVMTPEGVPAEHRLAFGNARGYFFKDWRDNKPETIGTINLNTLAKDKQPADALAVPLAADPSGRCLICTGPIHPETNKNVLWAYVAGDYSKESLGNRLMEGHEGRVVSAAWAKDGTTAATGDDKGRIIFWDAKTMKEVRRVETAGRVAALALTADAKKIAAIVIQDRRGVLDAYLEEVYVWDTATPPKEPKPLLTELKQKYGPMYASIAFAPNGKELACCFANPLQIVPRERVIGKVHVLQVSDAPAPKDDNPLWKTAQLLTDHDGPVNGVAFAPDGKTFASVGGDKAIVWDATNRKAVTTIRVKEPSITGVAFDPYSKNLGLAAGNGYGLYDTSGAQVKNRLLVEWSGKFTAIAFAQQTRRVGATDGRTLRVRSSESEGKPQTKEYGPLDTDPVPKETLPAAVAFCPTDDRVLFIPNSKQPATPASDDVRRTHYIVAILHEGEVTRTLKHGTDRVTCAAWSPDGKLIATADAAGTVYLWDATTLKERRRTTLVRHKNGGVGGSAVALVFAPDSQSLAVGSSDPAYRSCVEILTTATLDSVSSLGTIALIPASLAYSPDGQTLVAACRAEEKWADLHKGGVMVWQRREPPIITPKRPKVEPPPAPLGKWPRDPISISDPQFDILGLSVAGNNETFAIHTGGKTYAYDIASQKRLFRVNGQLPAFMKDSLFTWDERIAEYDATTGKEKNTFPPEGKSARGHIGAFSTDGKRVLVYDGLQVDIHTANGKTLTLEGLPTDKARVSPTFRGHTFAWSPDGTKVAGFGMNESGGTDHLGVWDTMTGKRIARQFKDNAHWTAAFACVAWHPDGKHLIVSGLHSDDEHNTLVQWLEAATLKEVPDKQVLIRSRDGGADVTALAVTADGKTVALATKMHSGKGPLVRVLLWTIGTTEITEHLLPAGDTPPITDIAFTPDQRTLVATTGSRAGEQQSKEILHRVLLWRWEPTK